MKAKPLESEEDRKTHTPYRVLHEYSQRGRGMFAVDASDAENRAQEDRDVAELLARYPGAEVTSRSGCERDYQLRVPGCGSAVSFRWLAAGWDPEVTLKGWAMEADLEAWKAFRATCPKYKETE